MTYTVQHRYYSSLCDQYGLGPLAAGATIDLTEDVAAAINRDSPGTLAPVAAKPAPERAAKAAHDRAAKPAANRRA